MGQRLICYDFLKVGRGKHKCDRVTATSPTKHNNHSPENPVWKIPGFCYLECINLALERNHYWPANPTVYTFANFGEKYRKSVNFCLIETIPGKHFTVKTFPEGDSRLAWKRVEFLAKTEKSFMHVGGDDDDSSGVMAQTIINGDLKWKPY